MFSDSLKLFGGRISSTEFQKEKVTLSTSVDSNASPNVNDFELELLIRRNKAKEFPADIRELSVCQKLWIQMPACPCLSLSCFQLQ